MLYVEEYSTSVRYVCSSGNQSTESVPYVGTTPRRVRTGITENAIKRIGKYLLGTKNRGLSFKPSNNLSHLECYADADFAGNHTIETCEDPNYVKSRTGCVIEYGGIPITWFFRFQTEIFRITIEAE